MQSSIESATTQDGPTPIKAASPRRLIVLVPGYNGHSSRWKPLQDRLKAEPGFGADEAKWLAFDHESHRRSLGTLDKVARQLNARIEAEWTRAGGFDEVVLVGHSMGGLIVRQAYLLAVGAVPGREASEWGQFVVRIVLLASLNRGVDPTRKLWMRFLVFLARIIPFLPHIRTQDTIRGSDFLTNLRINWIRYCGAMTEAARMGELWPSGQPKRAPLVVQFLGTEDGLVNPDDSKDVLAFPGGHYIEVPDADHSNLYQIEIAPDPETRYAVLRKGFTGKFREDPARAAAAGLDVDPIKRVIFLLHGIRASNVDEWIAGLEQHIAERDPSHTEVKHPTYGYFTAARFTLPSVRRRNIRVFQDWYTEALAEHPNAEFNIIAHSNGTYILGESMRVTPGMRFVNVALAGSVLPTNFPWGELKDNGQVVRVRNNRANRDWPVALLCNAMRGLFMRDVGTGGFAGFEGQETDEVAFYPGGHGTALSPDNQKPLVDFVFGEEVKRPAILTPSPGYFRSLSNAMPYLIRVLALLVLVGVGLSVYHGNWAQVLWGALAAIITYVILDII